MTPINFITVKIGSAYTATDVNRVLQMVRKTTKHPFNFFCYTENGDGLDPSIKVIPYIEHGLDLIVANKLFLLSNGFGQLTGRCVYFDVDIIIKENIDEYVAADLDGTLRTVLTYWKSNEPSWQMGEDAMLDYFFSKCYHRLNSSIMMWDADAKNVHAIWEDYYSNPEYFMVKYPFGMDAYLAREQRHRLTYLPRGVVCSHGYGRFEKSAREEDEPHPDWRTTDVVFILLNGFHTPETYAMYSRYFL